MAGKESGMFVSLLSAGDAGGRMLYSTVVGRVPQEAPDTVQGVVSSGWMEEDISS